MWAVGYVQSEGPGAACAAPGREPVAAVPEAAGADAVAERVLAIVSEKTGYPGDMLELDLDLEADLLGDQQAMAAGLTRVAEPPLTGRWPAETAGHRDVPCD